MIVSSRERHMRRPLAVVALFTVAALVTVACGGSRKDNTATTGGGSTGTGPAKIIDPSVCPAGTDTVGVTGNTITIGTSLPQSGPYSAFVAILKGEQSYFDYVNAQGGVEVAGKKYQIKLVAKDDAYDAGKTVTNVQSLINDSKVFALFNVVGTKNNLAIRNFVNTNCVPDLLIASGAVQWGNEKFPWMLGSELVPYPLEMRAFVDYLKQKKPNATIALLRASDDFGQSYEESLKSLIKGTTLKLVQTQTYDAEGADVKSQVTSLAATHADAFVIGAALLACPAALNAKGDAGWHPITYMSGTCVSKLLLLAGGKNSDGLVSVTPLIDPSDPNNDSNPAMQLYKTTVKKYSDADVSDGIVAYGWTTAALFAEILRQSPALTRTAVMETARTISAAKNVALQLPGSTWDTSAKDWFIGEDFQLVQYNLKQGHFDLIGSLINDDGKTASLSPSVLLNS
ncbi:MAG: branched-chain amino acid transport system substrate-binding protein [Actinomycetota bacterium]|jgi:branched-chain amino acid transport system substrate-binding protein|nr:branched-chain amino acid transport system substrate-binding protein [Actinomycetota bacterium]